MLGRDVLFRHLLKEGFISLGSLVSVIEEERSLPCA